MRQATSAFSGCSASSFFQPAAVPSAYGRKISASRFSGSRDMSAMSRPANFTRSASGRSRLPWHVGAVGAHHVARAPASSSAALSVLANVSSTYFRAPVNVPM